MNREASYPLPIPEWGAVLADARSVPTSAEFRRIEALFALLGGEPSVELNDQDWVWIGDRATQHRLAPNLFHLASEAGVNLPPAIAESWLWQSRSAAIASLAQMAELARLFGLLSAKEFGAIALKGAYLDAFAYPKPGLRPMRDIDLWLPRDQLIPAFQMLEGNGYARDADDRGDLNAILAGSHQLPMLVHEDGLFQVELHSRLFHGDGPDLSGEPDFQSGSIEREVCGQIVRFPSPTHQLLHLIVHSARDHLFDNGPQILPDLAYLIATTDVDWAHFWALADRFGERATANLLLAMVRQMWPEIVIEKLPPNAFADIILIARSLMVQDLEQHDAAALSDRLTPGDLGSTLFPKEERLEFLYGRDGGKWPRLIRHWYRLATERLPVLWRGKTHGEARRQAALIGHYRTWLNQQSGQ